MALLFCDGFDHYGSIYDAALKWSSSGGLSSGSLGVGRVGGQAVIINNGASLGKTLANLQTVICGAAFKLTTLPSSPVAYLFRLLESGTIQIGLSLNTLGQLVLYRNGGAGTLLATSTQTIITGAWNFIELKAKIASGTSGTYEVRVNGQTWMVSAGANTQQTANAFATEVGCSMQTGQSFSWYVDDFYVADTTGTANADFLGDIRVQTIYPASDVSRQMAATAIMGTNPQAQNSTTSAPGANMLVLQKVTAPATGTVTQIQIAFNTGNVGAKYKAVIYSDSSGSVGTLLTNGTSAEVTGTTAFAGIPNTCTFTTPPSVTSGTSYWIGYIIDTNVSVLLLSSASGTGVTKTNTYTSGAPSSPTSLTSNSNLYQMAATVTGISTDYQSVADTLYDADCSYAFDATAGHVDTYSCGSLTASTGSVKGVQVSPIMRKTDAGARTARYNLITSATTANGTTQAPGTSYVAYPGMHNFQADGTTGWTAAAVNALNVSVEIIT